MDGHLVMTDAEGKPIDSEKLACRLVCQRRFGSGPRGFNNKLAYPKSAYRYL
jgi:hypothetical protein